MLVCVLARCETRCDDAQGVLLHVCVIVATEGSFLMLKSGLTTAKDTHICTKYTRVMPSLHTSVNTHTETRMNMEINDKKKKNSSTHAHR